jgi:hypothetical protein
MGVLDCRDRDDEVPGVNKGEFIEVCVLFLKHDLINGNEAYWIAQQNDEIIS